VICCSPACPRPAVSNRRQTTKAAAGAVPWPPLFSFAVNMRSDKLKTGIRVDFRPSPPDNCGWKGEVFHLKPLLCLIQFGVDPWFALN
jgi:hypothetical protein